MTHQRFRVLHLTDNLELGGVQRILVDLVRRLQDRGHILGVAANAAGDLWGALPSNVASFKMPDRRRSVWLTIRYFRRLRRILRSGEWDVVHAHQRGVSLVARLASVGTTTKVVEHVHNVFPASPLARLASFRSHHLIACGSAIGSMLINDFRRCSAHIDVIPNAVSDYGYGQDLTLPSELGSAPRIIGVGRLAPQKDPLRFVEVLEILNRDTFQVTGEWVGDGPLYDDVSSRITRGHLQGVELNGWSHDVAKRILAADVLLISSRWEGLPLVALEALSLGRGIVAPNVGSCPDVVKPGRNGDLFDKDAPASEVARIIQAAIDSGAFTAWGQKSRTIYLRSGGPEEMAARVERVYERVLQSRAGVTASSGSCS